MHVSVRTKLFVQNCSYTKTVRTRRVIVKHIRNINILMINHCTHASRELIIRINKLSISKYDSYRHFRTQFRNLLTQLTTVNRNTTYISAP
jgi:hypothetical protein